LDLDIWFRGRPSADVGDPGLGTSAPSELAWFASHRRHREGGRPCVL